jgi:hypothetical protein
MKRVWFKAVAIAAFSIFAITPAAQAIVIPPGATSPLDAFVGLEAGEVIVASSSTTDSFGPLSGVLRAAVGQRTTGALDFFFQVSNTSSAEIIARISTFGWDAYVTDVSQQAAGASFSIFADPDQGASTADRTNDGSTVGFNFDPHTVSPGAGLDPGEDSAIFRVRTTATQFTVSTMAAIDGASIRASSFAPTVPEPGSVLLLGVGLIGMGAAVRRKRSR